MSLNQWIRAFHSLSRKSGMNSEQPIVGGFQRALEKSRSAGYVRADVVETVVSKTLRQRDELRSTRFLNSGSVLSLLALVARDNPPTLRVLDFGCGAGIHFLQVLAFLGTPTGIHWNVVETPEMVAAASSELETDQLRFFTSIEAAAGDLEKIDLVFSNSSLPYTSDPFDYLERLLAIEAKNFLITRTPLGEHAEPKTYIQRSKLSQQGPGPVSEGFIDYEIQYPVTLLNRQTVERALKEKYVVRFWSREDSRLSGVGDTRNYTFFGTQASLA